MDKNFIEATLEVFRLRAELEAYRDESRKEQESHRRGYRIANDEGAHKAAASHALHSEYLGATAARLTQILDGAQFVPVIRNGLENTEG